MTTKDTIQAIEDQKDFLASIVTLHITTQAEADDAGESLKVVKELKNKIEGSFGEIKKKTHEAHKEASTQYKSFKDPFDLAEKQIKNAILDFVDREEKRLQLIAEKEQAVIRKGIDKELDRVGKKLKKLGDGGIELAEQKAQLLKEHERADNEEVKTYIENQIEVITAKMDNNKEAVAEAEEKTEAIKTTTPVAPTVTAPKVAGVSRKKIIKGVVFNKLELIMAIAEGKAPTNVLDVNQSVLNKLIQAGTILPGVKKEETNSLSGR